MIVTTGAQGDVRIESPVVSLRTACVLMTTSPASRGSVLVEDEGPPQLLRLLQDRSQADLRPVAV